MELRPWQVGNELRKADEPRDRVSKEAENSGSRGGPKHQQPQGQHASRNKDAGEG